MSLLIQILLWIPGVIFATTLHEFTRAAVSTALGDKKPKDQGRLTLNPIKHFEPIGFLLMIATMGFGWGKPVETSALYYKNRNRDTLTTAIAPTVANIVAAIVIMFVNKRIGFVGNLYLSYFLTVLIRFNISIAVYNLVPISPMDGIKVLAAVMPANKYFKYLQYEKMTQMIFLLLLFMGTTDIIIEPIIGLVTTLLNIITF